MADRSGAFSGCRIRITEGRRLSSSPHGTITAISSYIPRVTRASHRCWSRRAAGAVAYGLLLGELHRVRQRRSISMGSRSGIGIAPGDIRPGLFPIYGGTSFFLSHEYGRFRTSPRHRLVTHRFINSSASRGILSLKMMIGGESHYMSSRATFGISPFSSRFSDAGILLLAMAASRRGIRPRARYSPARRRRAPAGTPQSARPRVSADELLLMMLAGRK